MKIAGAVVVVLLAVASMAQIELPPEQNNYYLYWGEQRAGYYTYTLKPIPGGWQMFGETFLSVLAGGIPGKIRFISNWELDQKMAPVHYRMEIYSGDKLKQQITAHFEKDNVNILVDTLKRTIPIEGPAFILDTSTPDGWNLLAKSIDTSRDSTFRVLAVSPQLGKVQPMTIIPGYTEQDAAGQIRSYFTELGGLETDLFIKTKGNRLIYWNPKSADIVARWTPELNRETFMEAPASVDVLSKLGTTSHIPANPSWDAGEYPNAITLKVELKPTSSAGLFLENPRQSFKGTADSEMISGTFNIKAIEITPKGAQVFPAGPIATPQEGTLSPNSVIQSDNDKIAELAVRLTADCGDFQCAAMKISRWVMDSITANTRTISAKSALESVAGDAISKSRLACALLRSAGIPARVVGGYYLERGYWIRHHWFEVWLGEKPAWQPFDATTGEIGLFSAIHLTLWLDEGDLDPVFKNTIEISSWK